MIRYVRALARDPEAAMRALHLGPRQLHEVEHDRRVTLSATMPAIERYTGVLFDALDASSLSNEERDFANAHVVVQSALFGPVRALDLIPAYRLSFDSRLPQLGGSLKRVWSDASRHVLSHVPGLMLDLRSEGYAALTPLPARENAAYVRVSTREADGTVRALNHFNKQAKGLLARELIVSAIDHPDVDSLLDWAAGAGIELVRREGGLELVVPRITGNAGSLSASLR